MFNERKTLLRKNFVSGFNEIKKLHKQGYKNIVGIDEAGRGPLAGPVVASAVGLATAKIKNQKSKIKHRIQNEKLFNKIKDSKKLSAKQREKWHKILTEHPDIKWGVGIVSEKIIDKINILEATKLAMRKAIQNLEKKSGKPADFLIIDGNFTLDFSNSFQHYETRPRSATRTGLVVNVVNVARRGGKRQLWQKSVIKADEKIFPCIAAGIIAKVTRDRIMVKMHKKYPQYGFDRHKGYGTKGHLKALRKYGVSKIHRKSFGPVRNSLLLQRRVRVDFLKSLPASLCKREEKIM